MPAGLVRIASAAAVTVAALGPAAAEGIVRYQGLVQGGIVSTGNALGLSKAAASNAPGLLGSIGTFLATSTSSTDGSYPAGTTADWTLNGHAEHRWHGNVNLRRDGLDVARLMSDCRTIAFSAGSACASGSGKPSRVLAAIGLTSEQAKGSIRLGFSRYTTMDELEEAAAAINAAADAQL